MSFPPFILTHADTAVQSVVEPCNFAVYLHSKNPYLHLISRTSCNKCRYILLSLNSGQKTSQTGETTSASRRSVDLPGKSAIVFFHGAIRKKTGVGVYARQFGSAD